MANELYGVTVWEMEHRRCLIEGWRQTKGCVKLELEDSKRGRFEDVEDAEGL